MSANGLFNLALTYLDVSSVLSMQQLSTVFISILSFLVGFRFVCCYLSCVIYNSLSVAFSFFVSSQILGDKIGIGRLLSILLCITGVLSIAIGDQIFSHQPLPRAGVTGERILLLSLLDLSLTVCFFSFRNPVACV
jgi:drug/metabolite transporter (DMT)-like permease